MLMISCIIVFALVLTWAAKINKSGFTRFFYFAKTPQPDTPECQQKTQFSWATPTGTHGEYADEQLANLQKRICLTEFLRLGLIIGCQGAMLGLPKIKTTFWWFLFL